MLITIAIRKCICYDIIGKRVQDCINTDYNYVKYTAVIISSIQHSFFFPEKGKTGNILSFLDHTISLQPLNSSIVM